MFSQLSIDLTKKLNDTTKKTEGIYFSPKNDRDIIFSELKKLKCRPKTILEPSCGSCEFVDDCVREYPKAKITGIEYNNTIYRDIKSKSKGNVSILNKDALLFINGKYDLIVGNPPYFVVTDRDKDMYSELSKILEGKMNIYIYFMYHCIENLLNKDGFLAFIIPSSLKNCVSYNSFRNYIYEYCTIHNIINTGTKDFMETDTNTIIIILQKKKSKENKFILKWGSNVFFSEEYKKFEEYNNNKTLKELGICIKTGSIVWNQVKEYLTDDDTKDVLIYDTNFKNNELELNTKEFKKNHQKPTTKKYKHIKELVDQTIYGKTWDELSLIERKEVKQAEYIINGKINDWNNTLPKKQYISIDHNKKKPLEGPIILLNRGHGNTTYTSKCILLDESFIDFYAENHVYVLTSNKDTKKEQNDLLEKIYKYLQSDTFNNFIKLYVGNGAISKKELEEVFPIVISDV